YGKIQAGLQAECSLFVLGLPLARAIPMTTVISFDRTRGRREIIAELQRQLRQTESRGSTGLLSLGLPEIDDYLPHGGLSLGALHDIVPEAPQDFPSAFGFIIALLCRLVDPGPVLIVASRRGSATGRIHGHGLSMLGLDPGRVVLIEAEEEIQFHWA